MTPWTADPIGVTALKLVGFIAFIAPWWALLSVIGD